MTFALSLIYELWRATAKSAVSRHDTLRAFVQELVAVRPRRDRDRPAVRSACPSPRGSGSSSAVVFILVSIFYYNPKMMIERKPGLIDWVEDLVYTGLLFVAAALLTLEVSGLTLA